MSLFDGNMITDEYLISLGFERTLCKNCYTMTKKAAFTSAGYVFDDKYTYYFDKHYLQVGKMCKERWVTLEFPVNDTTELEAILK